MRRSPRVALAWIAAAIIALATAKVTAADVLALHRRARSLGPDVRVVLAARDVPLGARIRADDVRVVVLPRTTVAPDALHDAASAIDRVAAFALPRGDVVTARHLAGAGPLGLAGALPDGVRALHVVAKDGYRPPVGAVVDLFATFDSSVAPGGGSDRATVVARGAEVVAVDDPSASTDAAAAGATVLVAETQAAAVAYAATLGQIAFALAPPHTACCPLASGP